MIGAAERGLPPEFQEPRIETVKTVTQELVVVKPFAESHELLKCIVETITVNLQEQTP